MQWGFFHGGQHEEKAVVKQQLACQIFHVIHTYPNAIFLLHGENGIGPKRSGLKLLCFVILELSFCEKLI
jgi:hypothetical protein